MEACFSILLCKSTLLRSLAANLRCLHLQARFRNLIHYSFPSFSIPERVTSAVPCNWINECVLSLSPSARELELEDRQSRLQQELRERMAVEGEYWHSSTSRSPFISLRHSDVPPLRSPEDREGAGQGEADPERDAGGGGAAERPCGTLGGAEASGEGGRQGPGGRYALQRLGPELGLKWLNRPPHSSECMEDSLPSPPM